MGNKLNEVNNLLREKNALILPELDEVKEITIPQTSFSRVSDNQCIQVYYISDLHLDYHLSNNKIDINNHEKVAGYFDCIIKRMLSDNIAYALMHKGVSGDKLGDLIIDDYGYFRYLYRFLNKEEFREVEEKVYCGDSDKKINPILKRCLVIDGDVAADIDLIKTFFSRFFLRLKYYSYKNWKKKKGYISKIELGLNETDAIALYEERLSCRVENCNRATNALKSLEEKVGRNIYKTYANKSDYDAQRLIHARKDIPDYAYYVLKEVKRAEDAVEYFQENRAEIISDYKNGIHNEFKATIEEQCPIFYVLGNHEYVNYETVDEAVDVFKTELSSYGISVIHNDVIEYGNCVVCGGTGFAQYNPEYNADSLICARKMMGNRDYETEEGKKFEGKYHEALAIAEGKKVPLLVFSHYPVKDWLKESTSGLGYYFTGHTHHNVIYVNEKGNIYSDNQVGYLNEDYRLKRYPIGTIYNPFIDYEDGYYEITPQQYADFYLYNGETVGIGLIEKAIQSNRFYMIKRNGFYGFFLINNKRAQICAGGRPKNISEIASIEYLYNCFNLMVYQYVLALKPYRKFQEKISKEICTLNIPSFSTGRIHGCIVDVDFYHHIMINPFGEGTITYYYSPVFGLVQPFESFEKLLESVEEKNDRLLFHNQDYLSSKSTFLNNNENILTRITSTTLIGKISGALVNVDIAGGMYGVSKRMNQLQRLFSANILREWDNNLIGQILEIDDVDEYVSDKKLTDYQLVQKHWKNLMRIEPEKIDEKLVECATRWDRKCRFPYLDTEKKYGSYWGVNPMGEDGIREYINHIPKSVLRNTVWDFHSVLHRNLLKYYPLDCINSKDLTELLAELSGREVVVLLESISTDWSDTFGKHVAEKMNQKSRPTYCSKELWSKIRSFN